MKDNLNYDSIKEYYISTYALLRSKNSIASVSTFPFNNAEYVQYLDLMQNELSSKFAKFCKGRYKRFSTIPVSTVKTLLNEFYIVEQKEWEKIQSYQDSRPDLYD